jgi:hypothetical protein
MGWVKHTNGSGLRKLLVELAACTGKEVAESIIIDDNSR